METREVVYKPVESANLILKRIEDPSKTKELSYDSSNVGSYSLPMLLINQETGRETKVDLAIEAVYEMGTGIQYVVREGPPGVARYRTVSKTIAKSNRSLNIFLDNNGYLLPTLKPQPLSVKNNLAFLQDSKHTLRILAVAFKDTLDQGTAQIGKNSLKFILVKFRVVHVVEDEHGDDRLEETNDVYWVPAQQFISQNYIENGSIIDSWALLMEMYYRVWRLKAWGHPKLSVIVHFLSTQRMSTEEFNKLELEMQDAVVMRRSAGKKREDFGLKTMSTTSHQPHGQSHLTSPHDHGGGAPQLPGQKPQRFHLVSSMPSLPHDHGGGAPQFPRQKFPSVSAIPALSPYMEEDHNQDIWVRNAQIHSNFSQPSGSNTWTLRPRDIPDDQDDVVMEAGADLDSFSEPPFAPPPHRASSVADTLYDDITVASGSTRRRERSTISHNRQSLSPIQSSQDEYPEQSSSRWQHGQSTFPLQSSLQSNPQGEHPERGQSIISLQTPPQRANPPLQTHPEQSGSGGQSLEDLIQTQQKDYTEYLKVVYMRAAEKDRHKKTQQTKIGDNLFDSLSKRATIIGARVKSEPGAPQPFLNITKPPGWPKALKIAEVRDWEREMGHLSANDSSLRAQSVVVNLRDTSGSDEETQRIDARSVDDPTDARSVDDSTDARGVDDLPDDYDELLTHQVSDLELVHRNILNRLDLNIRKADRREKTTATQSTNKIFARLNARAQKIRSLEQSEQQPPPDCLIRKDYVPLKNWPQNLTQEIMDEWWTKNNPAGKWPTD